MCGEFCLRAAVWALFPVHPPILSLSLHSYLIPQPLNCGLSEHAVQTCSSIETSRGQQPRTLHGHMYLLSFVTPDQASPREGLGLGLSHPQVIICSYKYVVLALAAEGKERDSKHCCRGSPSSWD